jgi:hypothetical protein
MGGIRGLLPSSHEDLAPPSEAESAGDNRMSTFSRPRYKTLQSRCKVGDRLQRIVRDLGGLAGGEETKAEPTLIASRPTNRCLYPFFDVHARQEMTRLTC